MRVTDVVFSPSQKSNVLAECRFQLTTDEGEFLIVDRARVLINKTGEKWLSLPNYSVQTAGRGYQYFPTIHVSRGLRRLVEDAVLPAFERWAAQSQQLEGVRDGNR